MTNLIPSGVARKRPGRTYYIKPVNINYSFATLEAIATDMGAEINEGDVIVADNSKGDKRKAFLKTELGSVIVYARMHGQNEFFELSETKGIVKNQEGSPMLSLFRF